MPSSPWRRRMSGEARNYITEGATVMPSPLPGLSDRGRAGGLGPARGDRRRACGQRRPGVGRHQAGHVGNRAGRSSAALRRSRRCHQGRYPLRCLHLPGVSASPPFPMKEHVSRDRVLEALYQADLREPRRSGRGLARPQPELCGGGLEGRRRSGQPDRGGIRTLVGVEDGRRGSGHILRLALYELLNERTPAAVVLDEAVELAKRYSTEKSGAFVNGVLAALAAEVRSGEIRPGQG